MSDCFLSCMVPVMFDLRLIILDDLYDYDNEKDYDYFYSNGAYTCDKHTAPIYRYSR